MRLSAILLIGLLTLSACGPHYPAGLNQEQWNVLTPAQQQKLVLDEQQRQAEIARQQQIALQQQQQLALDAERTRLEASSRQRLGISDAEWQHITPEKRFELRQEQERIEREQNAQAAAANATAANANSTLQIAEALREGNRQTLYTNSAYGTVVDCEISGGKAKFPKKVFDTDWYNLDTTRFSLAKGDAGVIPIRRQDKQKLTSQFWVGLNDTGLEFCESQDTPQRYKRCRVHPLTSAFEQSYTAPFDIPNVIAASTITCRYAPGRK